MGEKVDDEVVKVLLVGRTHNGQLDQASIQSFYQIEQKSVVVDLFIVLQSDASFGIPSDILEKLRHVLVGGIAKEGPLKNRQSW